MKLTSNLERWAAALLAAASLHASTVHAGTHVWGGAGGNKYWSTAANWSSGGVPSANEGAPVVLEFPAAASGASTNDLNGLKVDSLRLLGSGIVLRGTAGNALTFKGTPGTNLHCAGVNYLDTSLGVVLQGTNRIAAPVLLTVNSVISGSGGLEINGAVQLDGTSPNTFTGGTVVKGGTLMLDKLGGLTGVVSIPGPLVIEEGRVALGEDNGIADDAVVTVQPGAVLDLDGHDDAIGSLMLSGGVIETDAGLLTLGGGVRAQSFGATINGRLSLGSTTRTFEVDPLATLIINAVISNGGGVSHPGIAKTGNGTLRLMGANTFSGAVNVFAGTVEVGNSSALGGSFLFGTTVAANAFVRLLDGVVVPAEQLTLNGGYLYAQGNATWAGPVTLNTNSHLRSLSAAGDLQMLGVISGPGGFSHAGPGRLTIGGTNANTFAGDVHVTEGDLWLLKSDGQVAVPGNLFIGSASNANNENVLFVGERDQIGDASIVTLLSSAALVLNNVNDTVGGLVLDGAEVNTGTGLLTLAGDVTVQPSTDLSRISGRLSLGGAVRQFEIQASPLVPALLVTAAISGGGTSGMRKIGAGMLWLSGDNSYAGQTVVGAGELVIDHPHALGQATLLDTSGTVVEAGATLNTVLPATTVMEPLTLWGDGAATNGAWIVQGGALNWGGRVHLGDVARINIPTTHTLTLTNLVTGFGAFRKVGAGTLTFAGTTINTFQDESWVDEGRIHCAKPDGFTAISGGLYIGRGAGSPEAAVQLFADQQIDDTGGAVMVNTTGLLDLNGHVEDIRTLYGHGDLDLGSGELRVFRGSFSGVISGTGRLRKISPERLSFSGNNTYTGDTTVEEGRFSVFGALASTNVHLLPGAELGGDGSLKNTVLNHATLAPGLFEAFDVFSMSFANLTLSNSAVFTAEIRGSTPGTTYDQLNVTDTVRLNNAVLDLKLGFPGAANTAYLLINNAGNDAVQGTFAGKPEGASFTVAGAQFQITYQGGDGNDVVALQLSPATNSFAVRLQVTPVPGTNQVVVSWPTFATDYNLFRCTNLTSGGWTQVFGAKVTSNDFFHQTFGATNECLVFRLQKP